MTDLLPALAPILARVRTDVTWKKLGPKTSFQKNVPLGKTVLRQHLESQGVRRGVCPIKEGESTVELAVFDLDDHNNETGWDGMKFACAKVYEHLQSLGCHPVAFRSTGGSGIHIYLIWDEPQDAYSVREFLRKAIEPLGFKPGAKGVAHGQIEIFPKQDKVEMGRAGNQFILPLAGQSVPLDPLFDFDPLEREDALDIQWKASIPVPLLTKPEVTRSASSPRQYTNGKLLELESALNSLTADTDYDDWLKVGMSTHYATGGAPEGLELWDSWSAKAGERYPGYDLLQSKWNGFRSDRDNSITAGYILKRAEAKGWQPDYSTDFDDITEPIPEDQKPKKNRFKLIRADNYLKRERVDWTIKGILPRKSSGMTYGGSGDGKTFAILDLACAVALGVPWNNRKVRQGHVVYVCAEGAGGFITRLQAYAQEHQTIKTNLGDYLTVIPAAPNFLKKEDVLELAAEIKSHNKETELIIIDTLAQTSTGADENSAKDMNIMLKYVSMLRDLTDASSHLIHHAGKDENRGARGSSTLKADCDVQFRISREGERRLFWVDKMKDGRDKFGWYFDLTTIPLGEDEDGDEISSCIVKYDNQMTSTKKIVLKKHGYWEDLVLKAWETLGGDTIEVEAVIEEAKRNSVWDKGGKDRRREYSRRALQSLSKEGEITIRDEKIVVELGPTD